MKNKNNSNKHLWFSGRIRAYQAREPGSIPGGCKLFLLYFGILYLFLILNISRYFYLLDPNEQTNKLFLLYV